MSAENASILWGEVVVDELARAGVRHVVITPGSRSTPLVVAAARHPQIVDHSLIDERSAAFFALGIGLATGVPAALVCTSGTAVANYLPAVAEADLAAVPLVVLTADRPPNLSDAGASQAMVQNGIFGDKVRWACDLGLPAADAELLAHARARAARAAHVARSRNGPVHLNLPFRKPLEQSSVADTHRDAVPAALRTDESVVGRPNGAPWTSFSSASTEARLPGEVASLVKAAERPAIVVGAPSSYGFWETSRLNDLLTDLVATWDVPVIAESSSGLRLHARTPNIVDGDLLLADEAFVVDHAPDLVLQIGRWPINWPVQRWLQRLDAPRVVIGTPPADPSHTARHVVDAAPWCLESLADLPALDPAWRRAWSDRARTLRARFDARADEHPELDGHVARELSHARHLFVSSSMPLRDIETWIGPAESGATIWANRGLNGIDGVISTAAGVAVALEERVDLLIGDVAFVHDIGGLVSARRVGAKLGVHVVDNGGGRIFDHLPIANHDAEMLQKHFTTAPDLDLRQVAEAFGFDAVAMPVSDFVAKRPGASVVIIHAPADGQSRRRELLDSIVDPARDISGREEASAAETGDPAAVADAPIPLVLLHGFTGDASTWDGFREHYSGPTFALDLLAHGGRPAPSTPSDASIDAFVDDVVAQLHAAGITRFDLMGYSMGGRVAMALAAREPGRIRRLVTLGAHPGIEAPLERLARRDDDWALADRLERDGLEAFLDYWLELPIFASLKALGPDWYDSSIAQRRRGSAAAYAQALRGAGTGSQPPLWSSLAIASIPHLALAGESDHKYVAIARELAERLDQTVAATIPDAGHSAHYERPARVAALVADFLHADTTDSDVERNAS